MVEEYALVVDPAAQAGTAGYGRRPRRSNSGRRHDVLGRADSYITAAEGYDGGKPGGNCRIVRNHGTNREEEMSPKQKLLTLEAGETVRMRRLAAAASVTRGRGRSTSWRATLKMAACLRRQPGRTMGMKWSTKHSPFRTKISTPPSGLSTMPISCLDIPNIRGNASCRVSNQSNSCAPSTVSQKSWLQRRSFRDWRRTASASSNCHRSSSYRRCEDGIADVSPRGDAPGFVQVIDDETIAIPDRPGNNRLDTLTNILGNPSVGTIFSSASMRSCASTATQNSEMMRSCASDLK